ncbi:MAG: hypothetical protein MUF14_01025 [Hyphomonadaceae bacterium]|jgi:2-keto-4-pentenoate hydratase|nr:hypothetical protein [Hyphomonadaceae bacterium]
MQIARTGSSKSASRGADVARAFRAARLSRTSLSDFPGPVPEDLETAYSIQCAAIADWPDTICGWKVGRILGDLVTLHGTDRLIGPIFSQNLQHAQDHCPVGIAAIEGGFCAVEAELVFVLGADAPDSDTRLAPEHALDLASELRIGIEIAGSPLATINDLGPCVVVSDFGNNAGLILGPPLANWRARLGEIEATTWIDGTVAGSGTDGAFPKGIAGSLLFAIQQTARMGLPLKAGMLVSTGAISGVHDIRRGQSARCGFGTDGADGIINVVCEEQLVEALS